MPAWPRGAALLLAVAFLSAPACRARPETGSRPSPTPSPAEHSATTLPTPGCRSPDLDAYAGRGRAQTRSLTVGGEERTFRIFVPASAAPADPAPLVLNFHGLGSSGAEQERYSGLLAVAAREGFVLVSPDGRGQPRRWGIPGLPSEGGLEADLAFVDALVAELGARLCLDAARIYATGLSNGAFFSSALACLRPEMFAAVAPVAGIYFPPGGCKGEVPLLAIHGRLDEVVPYGPGLIFGLVPYRGAEAYAADWARQNRCRPEWERLQRSPHVVETSWRGCKAETVLLTVEDGGHTWPGAFDVPRLGPTNREFSAADAIWAFFERHARRPAPRAGRARRSAVRTAAACAIASYRSSSGGSSAESPYRRRRAAAMRASARTGFFGSTLPCR
ncbi:hypothetical protein HRbin29_02213 [bacterium HR29]|nr:hypothetical protein HRbin29_02213 [bacterium HR29]